MSWIRHNRQIFDWQVMPTYVPVNYTLETTSLYGHLTGIDLLFALLQQSFADLADIATTGSYTDLIDTPNLDHLTDDAITLTNPHRFIRVSGAGYQPVNGIYKHNNEFAPDTDPPKPLYRHTKTPELVITYLPQEVSPAQSDHDLGWVIAQDSAGVLYTLSQPSVSPDPTPDIGEHWQSVNPDDNPPPHLEPLQASMQVDRLNAMRFYFPFGDYLHGDGNNLFYTAADGQTEQLTNNS